MKTLVMILFSSLILAQPSRAALDYQSNSSGWKQLLSEAILSRKCGELLRSPGWYCNRVTQEFLTALDMQLYFPTPDNRQIVFFKTDTLKIIHDPRLKDYLRSLDENLSLVELGLVPDFDLYTHTQKFLNSAETADLWIGLLFQDNNFNFHKQWLKNQGMDQALLNLYLKVYDRLSAAKPEFLAKIHLYPAEIETHHRPFFTDKLYYYFLPRIVQTRLNKLPIPTILTNYPKVREYLRIRNSFSVMVTLLYMYHHFYGGPVQGVLKLPVSLGTISSGEFKSNGELEKVGLKKEAWMTRYEDLYMAYVATIHGRDLKIIPQDQIARGFWVSPIDALVKLSYSLYWKFW